MEEVSKDSEVAEGERKSETKLTVEPKASRESEPEGEALLLLVALVKNCKRESAIPMLKVRKLL